MIVRLTTHSIQFDIYRKHKSGNHHLSLVAFFCYCRCGCYCCCWYWCLRQFRLECRHFGDTTIVDEVSASRVFLDLFTHTFFFLVLLMPSVSLTSAPCALFAFLTLGSETEFHRWCRRQFKRSEKQQNKKVRLICVHNDWANKIDDELIGFALFAINRPANAFNQMNSISRWECVNGI